MSEKEYVVLISGVYVVFIEINNGGFWGCKTKRTYAHKKFTRRFIHNFTNKFMHGPLKFPSIKFKKDAIEKYCEEIIRLYKIKISTDKTIIYYV